MKKEFTLVTLGKKGNEIYGQLYLNDKPVGHSGFWRTTDKQVALQRAIEAYELSKWEAYQNDLSGIKKS